MSRWKQAFLALALIGLTFFPGDRLFLGIDLASAQTPVPLGRLVLFPANLTPVATAATIQTVEQTFTVTGVQVNDYLMFNGPAPTALCAPVTIRASALNTVAIGFAVLTAAACTPAAGFYNIVAIR